MSAGKKGARKDDTRLSPMFGLRFLVPDGEHVLFAREMQHYVATDPLR